MIFKSFQYSKAIPPFLRQNDMTFYSSVDDNEKDSIIDTLGKHNTNKLNLLRKLQVQVKLGKAGQAYFHYPMGTKGKLYHKYHARHPFLPYLYYNGISARIVVSPLRTWIDPICSTCDMMDESEGDNRETETQNIIDQFISKFGNKATAKSVLRQVAMQNGVDVNLRKTSQGIKFIQKYMDNRLINLPTLLKAFGLEETRTHINPDKQPEYVNPLKEKDET